MDKIEKTTAHYSLDEIKALVRKGAVRITQSALTGAALLGYNRCDIIYVVENIEEVDLYKSMIAEFDTTLWQDVYHYPAEEGIIYLKLQIQTIDSDECVVISFKEK